MLAAWQARQGRTSAPAMRASLERRSGAPTTRLSFFVVDGLRKLKQQGQVPNIYQQHEEVQLTG